MNSFEVQIDKFVKATKEKMLAVVKNSIQDIVNDAQTPVEQADKKPVKNDGKMPVDTGFLRASASAALNQLPQGETLGRKRKKGETGVLYQYSGDFLPLVLGKMKIGDTFYFGWAAVYANKQNMYHGFLDSAVDKWAETVKKNCKELK